MWSYAKRWTVPLVLGALIAGFITYTCMKQRTGRHPVSPITQGVFYRSGQLGPEKLTEEIRRRGIRTVVNLGSRTEWTKEACEEAGVRYVDLPVGDVWSMCGVAAPEQESPPGAPADLEPLWSALSDPAARPVLIHCWGGVHRTGVATAIYRIVDEGWEPEDAIAEMDRFGFDSGKSKFDNVTAYLRSLRSAAQTAAAHSGPAAGESRR